MRLAFILCVFAVGVALNSGCEPSEGQPRAYPDSTDTATQTATETITDTGSLTDTDTST